MKNEKKKRKKRRKLWHVSAHVGTGTHLPTAGPGGRSLPYLQCIIGKGCRLVLLHMLYGWFFIISVMSGDVQMAS